MAKELHIRINGYAKWSVVIIFVLTLLYNTIVTHVTLKNEVNHIKENVAKLETKVEKLSDYVMKK